MSATPWPSNLPEYPLRDGFGQAGQETMFKSSPTQGPIKTRPKYSVTTEPVQLSIVMTTTQYNNFLDFFHNILEEGSLPFSWIDWITGFPVDYQFLSKPSVSYWAISHWQLNMSLQAIPR